MTIDRHTANRARRSRAALLAAVLICAAGALAAAPLGSPELREPRPFASPGTSSATAVAPQEHAPATAAPATAEESTHEPAHEEPFWKTLARLFNFAILAGVLVYFLRAPIGDYLARRSTEIRSELTKAADTREAASRELARVEEKMAALPREIAALKARGAEEIAAEEARIAQAADTERERLLQQARREIELQLRTAERDLVKHAAELAVGLASDRIKRTITRDDQDRLVSRYLSQLEK
jgi:F-type H+-transporting ATPase subunit b